MSQTRVLVSLAGAAISATTWAGTPDQDRAYAAELKADSLNKSSALESNSGLTAADGDSKVVLGGFTQFRYTMNFRDDPSTGGLPHQSGFTNGFDAPTTRLQATGNVMSKDFTFKVEGNFNQSGEFSLLDAFSRWAFDNGSSVIIGQFQNPLWREWSMYPKGSLAADVSVVTAVFNPGYTQGVAYNFRNDQWNFLIAADDGLQSGNTPYTTGSTDLSTFQGGSNEANIGVSTRIEFKGGGDWKLFDDFSGWRGQETAWLIGLGGHWENDGNTNANTVQYQGQQFLLSLDAQVEGNGWNVYGGVIWSGNSPGNGGGDSVNNFGFIVQGGYMFTDNVEGFIGWNGIALDSAYGQNNDNNFNTGLVGLNFYPFAKSSAVKFTTDLQWFWNAVNDNAATAALAQTNNNVGLLPSSEDNQVAIRFQLQVSF